jgi:hypothetical protein
MNAAALAPRSVGQILDFGFSLYRRAFVSLIPIMILQMLCSVIEGAFSPAMTALLTGAPLAAVPHGEHWLAVVLGLIVRLYLFIVILRRLDDLATREGTTPMARLFSDGARLIAPNIGLVIVLGIIIVLATLCLILPGIFVMVLFYFAPFALAVEETGIGESMRRSRDLVRGSWWRVAGILSLAMLIVAAITVAVGTGMVFVLPFLHVASAAANTAAFTRTAAVASLLFFTVIYALLYPLGYSFILSLFYDLRVRQAGGDLAARIAAG